MASLSECRTPAAPRVRALQERETVSKPDLGSETGSDGPTGLTGALGKVGDVFVVEHHLVLQHVGQSSEPRPAHDAHQRSNVCLRQQPVGGGLAVLIAVTRWTQISNSRPYSHMLPSSDPDHIVTYHEETPRHWWAISSPL